MAARLQKSLRDLDDGSFDAILKRVEQVTENKEEQMEELTKIVVKNFVNKVRMRRSRSPGELGVGVLLNIANVPRKKRSWMGVSKRQKVRNINNTTGLNSSDIPTPPEELVEHIKNMYGPQQLVLVIEKNLAHSDLNSHQGRFSIPRLQVRAKFLEPDEKHKLKKSQSIDVTIIDPSFEETTLTLKRWRMNKTFSYMLCGKWNEVKGRNAEAFKVNAKTHAVVQLWSFRRNPSRLCFALNVVA
ncbi:B3 domain-containing protein At2g31420-like [Durio zibethinus]|uniref:B3 domain-containing protein At2g31420-like n=1 Tax=Durio zibethinus TaxID=66656 RepID=A0A6P5WU77_DURZI|nr:B3 domain-containing protein At2g31420-like [Durio zibethinus]